MYIIIDTTTGKVWKHDGIYPGDFIDRIVNKEHTPVVISNGSNTIGENGITEVIDRDELLYYRNLYIFDEY